MKAREATFVSIGLALLLVDIILPFSIPFMSMFVFGFLLNFVSMRNVFKIIILTSILVSLEIGVQYGIFGFGIFGFLLVFGLYFLGAIGLLPMSYHLFKKFKVRERIGY